MGRDAKKRFIDLHVCEVSLVDSPANEVPFHVVKQKRKPEDLDMVAKASSAEAATVQVEHDSDAPADTIRRVLKSVENIVKSATGVRVMEPEKTATESVDISKGATAQQ